MEIDGSNDEDKETTAKYKTAEQTKTKLKKLGY